MSFETVVPMVITGITGAWISPVILGIINGRGARMKVRVDADVALKEQSNKMLLEVMKVSQGQIETLMGRLAVLEPLPDIITNLRRDLQDAVARLHESIEHLVSLTVADTLDDRRVAVRRALAFVKRMNALGVVPDAPDPVPADMQGKLDKMP